MNPLEMASQYYGEGLNILPSNFPQKVESKLKKKKKEKKEKKPKDEPRVFLGEWVDDGVESSSSSSSSDESIKSTTTRTNKGVSSSSNTCHVVKGMDSNISDDDSNSSSIKDLLDLVHEHQRVIRKQSREIKNRNALNDLNVSLATNYEDLLCKFKLLSKEHEELKSKFESINNTNDFLEMKQSTPSTNSNSKVDASTSCFNLIDESNPCNEKCFENIVVEPCDLIAKKNNELK